ncbi:LOW QUALITY PROTEIN: rab15 effector protein [Pipra filicauda]|uniref:LOW QUALITY PROTEIN: rab15 effector protein n=1 Tax=Pipra filicauda TaxID=649802 RepID=A0A6J2FWS7_9PASS|nr:LOW QUALITY PROTEIN: rab15 effector protein [Pipra filicauda]
MWKRPSLAQKMGQKASQEDSQEDKAETLLICDVFSQGVLHASQRLKDYLGFVDPQSKFQPATNTLSEIFLVNFISFCMEKGAEELIVTSKMTRQQSCLFGVDWIWTLSGADKQIKLQIAVHALQLAELFCGPAEEEEEEDCCREAALADECFQNMSWFGKLAEFCRLVGQDCLGLFVAFGVPGKPKDIRGVLLDSIAREEQKCRLSGRNALRQFVTGTDSTLPTKDMLENCLGTNSGLREVGNVYTNFV